MSDHILVIGGGIIGLLTARELVQAGAQVTLTEMGETGRESSWAGGGIVSPLYPWRYADAINALAGWSQGAYPQLCTELQHETGIDAELTASGLLILDSEEHDQALAWGDRRGAEIRVVEGARLQDLEPGLALRPDVALFMPTVGQVRNPRLVKALRASLEGRIGIREHEEVLELLTDGGRIRGARTAKGEIRADRVAVCTGAWTARLMEQLGRKPDIQPVRGQMLRFLARPGQISRIALYRDRYVIPRRDGRILAGSTLEHTGFVKETTTEAKEALYRAAVELYPVLRHTPIEDHWAGLRPGSPSGIPFIGPYPDIEGLYVNAGHFRNSVDTGPRSARVGADLKRGR